MKLATKKLLIHEHTKAEAIRYLRRPAHALLITGQIGSGKYTIAQAVAANLLAIENVEQLASYPYFLHLKTPDNKQEIPIEDVRAVLKAVQLKTPGKSDIRRVILIENADSLSLEAQNALLKTLEEPSLETVFLLTVPSTQNIAPTIVSRAQNLTVHPIKLDTALSYYSDQYSESQIESYWRLSGGSAGLLAALLRDDQQHPLKAAVDNFKKILTQNSYERLLNLDKLAKDKLELYITLDAAARVLRALQNNSLGRTKDVLESRKLVNRLQTALLENANPRLVALELALNLKV